MEQKDSVKDFWGSSQVLSDLFSELWEPESNAVNWCVVQHRFITVEAQRIKLMQRVLVRHA